MRSRWDLNPKSSPASIPLTAKIPGKSAVSNEYGYLWSASFAYKCGQRVGKQVTSIVVPRVMYPRSPGSTFVSTAMNCTPSP